MWKIIILLHIAILLSTSVQTQENDCVDPDLDKVLKGETFMLCDGTIGVGTLEPDPSVIRAGDTIAGVTGTYKGGIDIDPWNLRYGTSIGTIVGKLKLNCRNMVGHYDGEGPSFYDGGSTIDHNTDDNNYNGALGDTFPTINPWGSDEFFCGFNAPDDPSWERVVTTPATSGTQSIFRDKISGLMWTRGTSTGNYNWNDAADADTDDDDGAVEYCAELDHGGFGAGSWRLPTQKELLAAMNNGIDDLDDESTATDNLGELDFAQFWTITNHSGQPTWGGYNYRPASHNVIYHNRDGDAQVLCVSP